MLRRRPSALDHETALRLVAGAVQPDDAPPGYSRVALLLTEAASPPPPVPADRAVITVAAMVEALRSSAPAKAPRFPRLSISSRTISTRIAVATGTLVLTAGGAAAATGSLPPSLQDATARVASYVGLNLPFPARTDAGDGAGGDTSSTDPASPSAPAGAGHAGAGHSQPQPNPAFDTLPAGTSNGPDAGSSTGPGQAVVVDQPSRPQNGPTAPSKRTRPTDADGVDTKSEQPSDPGEPRDPRESEPAAPVEPKDPVEVEPPSPTEPRDPSEPGDPAEPAEGSGARSAFGPTTEDDDF